jgi:hypothetical protein
MLSIGWGTPTLLDIQVGVILEVPDPVRLAILGAIRVSIPSPEFALISLNVVVLGTVDFGLEKLAIDRTMYDSYVLEFQMSGEGELRFNWGGNPNFRSRSAASTRTSRRRPMCRNCSASASASARVTIRVSPLTATSR